MEIQTTEHMAKISSLDYTSHVDIIRNDYAKMITVIYISSWVRILLDIYVCTKQLSVPTVMKLLKFYVVQSSISGLFHK